MESIGHYRIIEEMGRGGMGVVYKGYEESLSRYVALKVLGEHLTRDPQFVQRFRREAQAAARISHPHIVAVHFVGEDAGRHFFAMEFLPGGSLENELRHVGRVEPARAARWMLETARGLAAAHGQGLIHRDIKPANLLLDGEGHIKIADFGLALATTRDTRLTRTGLFLGSPGYLSPEQCRGEELDGRTDIFSLGVTFYELLAGRLPFAGDSPASLILNIIQSQPPDIAALNPQVDPRLGGILDRMLAKDRGDRHTSARELAAELERYLGAATASAGLADDIAHAPTRLATTEAASALPRAMPGDTAPAPDATAPKTATRRSRALSRHSRLAAAGLIAFLVVASSVGLILLRRAPEEVPGETRQAVVTGVPGVRGDTGDARGSEAVPPVRGPAARGHDGPTPDRSGVTAAAATPRPGADAGAAGAATSQPPEVDPSREALPDREPRAPVEVEIEGPSATGDAEAPSVSAVEPVAPPEVEEAEQPASEPEEVASEPAAASGEPGVAPSGSVAVVALGEPLLASEVERYLENLIRARGLSMVDERGAAGNMQTGDPTVEGFLSAVRGVAETLVVVQAEALDQGSGSRSHARVSIWAIDVAAGMAFGRTFHKEIKYTEPEIATAVERKLHWEVDSLLSAL